MTKYLFRISTKCTDVWSRSTPKPVYVVCESKEDAIKFAEDRLNKGLVASKITRLGEQIATSIFTGI